MVGRKLVKHVVMAVEALKSSRGVKREALDNYLREKLGPQGPEQCRMAVEQALVEGLLLWKSGRYYPKPSETAAAEPSTSKRVGGRRGSRVTMKDNSTKRAVERKGEKGVAGIKTSSLRRRGIETTPRTMGPRGRRRASNMRLAEEDARSVSSSSFIQPRKRRRMTMRRKKSAPNFGTQVWKAWNSFWSPKREYKLRRKPRKPNFTTSHVEMDVAQDDVICVE